MSGAVVERVEVFGYELTYAHGVYSMSAGRNVDALESTVVVLSTSDDVQGYGETCPLGMNYLPAFASGARAALRELAPAVIGADACNPAGLSSALDSVLAGNFYAKSAIEIAAFDLFGRLTGVPVSGLLGGIQSPDFPLYVAVPLASADDMVAFVLAERANGIHRFQLKIGADPVEDAQRVRAVVEATGDDDVIIADANGGYRLQSALLAARSFEALPRLYFEQPCPTLGECIRLRRLTSLPIILDEVITDVGSLLQAHEAGAMEGVNLKVNRVGGLGRARLLREICEHLGLGVTVEDSWGGDVTTAAVSHLAATAAPETLVMASFMNDWTNEHIAGYEPRSRNGRGMAPLGPGLGIDIDLSLLEPLWSWPT
jgi:L-alanine-DL-glutamate epimerase-like enolase superfamily enzyme